MERVALDTTFLIDLQNERRSRGQPRGARHFLELNLEVELLLPVVALGEYLEGFSDPLSNEAQALIGHFKLLPIDNMVAHDYARVAQSLRTRGAMIGSNDLWIACTARAHGLAIVTRNVNHFRRIDGLQVVSYQLA